MRGERRRRGVEEGQEGRAPPRCSYAWGSDELRMKEEGGGG
jgi:hypothetical protein